MDDNNVRKLEKLFYKKIMLHNDLFHCLKKEKQSLINIDMDKLWPISQEKEKLCAKIESIRREITSVVSQRTDKRTFDLNTIMGLIPMKNRAAFEKLYLRLIKLRRDNEALRKENKILIDDSLQFLDEMLLILTGRTKNSMVYNKKCDLKKIDINILPGREV